jgi:hypothetical protein
MNKLKGFMLVLSSLTFMVALGQDPNHGELKGATHIMVFDTSAYYFPRYVVRFGSGPKGECIREYFGPDSIKYYVDYKEPDSLPNSISKGLSIEFFNSGGISNAHFRDWNGQKHGNFLLFHPNGAIKRNEVYERGKLKSFTNYDEQGKRID